MYLLLPICVDVGWRQCNQIIIIGGLMEGQVLNPEGSLNCNRAKELVWRRNAPYFYQTLYTQELEWPSLSVQWWVEESQSNGKDKEETTLCHLTYGTHTSGEEKNYLIMAKVYLPNQENIRKIYADKPIKPSEAIKKNDNSMDDKIIVQHEVEHEGEVNRIKHHPKKTNLIATRTPLGEVHIFDKTKFKTGRVKITPSLILAGHETQGYSLEWNPHREGNIIAGSYDGKLTLWDINGKDEGNKRSPLCYFNFHEHEIEDVSHNCFHDCIFASCDDDGQSVLWDTRNSNQPIFHMKSDSAPIYSIQFSPFHKNVFATGGAEKTIKLWDIRNMSDSLFKYQEPNSQQITQLKWSGQEKEKQVLWSVGGSNLTMWDLNQGKAKFIHSGHMETINQMDLHPYQPQAVASVDSNNELHVFQPTRHART